MRALVTAPQHPDVSPECGQSAIKEVSVAGGSAVNMRSPLLRAMLRGLERVLSPWKKRHSAGAHMHALHLFDGMFCLWEGRSLSPLKGWTPASVRDSDVPIVGNQSSKRIPSSPIHGHFFASSLFATPEQ